MRDLKKQFKQIRHCNIIPANLLKWVFLKQMEMVFSKTKTIFVFSRNTHFGKPEGIML